MTAPQVEATPTAWEAAARLSAESEAVLPEHLGCGCVPVFQSAPVPHPRAPDTAMPSDRSEWEELEP